MIMAEMVAAGRAFLLGCSLFRGKEVVSELFLTGMATNHKLGIGCNGLSLGQTVAQQREHCTAA